MPAQKTNLIRIDSKLKKEIERIAKEEQRTMLVVANRLIETGIKHDKESK